MNALPVPAEPLKDIELVKLAREIAINHFPIETILEHHQIPDETWEKIQKLPRFQQLLEHEIAEWNGALNTHERTALKAASIVEEFLEEGHARLHCPNENLNSKVELLKFFGRVAGMGLSNSEPGGVAEKFSVTINLGSDEKIQINKEFKPKTIEGNATEVVD